jgi:RHS repeat-associated protein
VDYPGGQRGAFLDEGVPRVQNLYASLLQDQADGTGLLYRRNRYYDPQTGRFTQEDPIGLAGGLNLYGYAGGDPVNFSDPFGLFTIIPGDAATERDLASLKDKSPTFKAAYDKLHARKDIVVKIGRGYAGGSMGTVDWNRASGDVIVTINDLDIANGNTSGKYFRGEDADVFTAETVIAHELYGHVYSRLIDLDGKGPRDCPDKPGTCPIIQENVIRNEIGIKPRKYGDIIPKTRN